MDKLKIHRSRICPDICYSRMGSHVDVEPRTTTVDIVLSFSPIVGSGTPPPPYPQACVFPPPLVWGGDTHSLVREGAGGPIIRRG
jgi:hypothetical protein